MKVSIDLDKCAGHARCFAASPDLFDLDDDGYALNAEIDVPAGQEATALEAVAACPERAIESH
ncbi:ferredoxin [Gordonia sp. PKS22-38]|uniref:Ferredoxin n=1 Tax=Gordonia prachuapensis TaxID=3115651 RepID=A0ABU7MSM7_9ACTN|nr:ferredoxin [Gordonia sp. PKS22-38]